MKKILSSNCYGYVYITKNMINGKRYIGKHKHNNKSKYYIGSGKILSRAIKKYGRENFKMKIVYIAKSKQELDFAEKLFIKAFNAVKSDLFYNIHEGGTGGNTLAGYSKEELKNFGNKISSSLKNNKSLVGKNNPMYGKGYKIKGEKNGFYGKTHSEETINRIKNKLGQDLKAYNNNETLVYSNKKSAYNAMVEKGLFKQSYGAWKYKIKQAIENKKEFCGYYWEEIENDRKK
jgi:group I intron endonuclease